MNETGWRRRRRVRRGRCSVREERGKAKERRSKQIEERREELICEEKKMKTQGNREQK